jgi:hypothetical protein
LCAGFTLALVCAVPRMLFAEDADTAAKVDRAAHATSGVHDHTATTNSVKTTSYSGAKTQAHRRRSRQASSVHRKRRTMARGQQKIDPERAQEIQKALIREHYLSGTAVGTWNQASEDAMRRYQADHGWQSKTVPDSRALISLGLGPSHDHLLNPESAMTSDPVPEHGKQAASTPAQPASIHSTSSAPFSAGPDSAPAAKSQSDPAAVPAGGATDPPHPQ